MYKFTTATLLKLQCRISITYRLFSSFFLPRLIVLFLIFLTSLKYSVHVLKRVWVGYFRFLIRMFLLRYVPGSAVCEIVI